VFPANGFAIGPDPLKKAYAFVSGARTARTTLQPVKGLRVYGAFLFGRNFPQPFQQLVGKISNGQTRHEALAKNDSCVLQLF
jgi:hypothetical protein